MSLYRTEAFVLRTYSLAEADKICMFLTKDLGKVRGVAHGARKLKSRFGSALEPFTEVALTYYHKEGRELMSISTCDILRSHFHQGARDVQTASAFSYMSELLIEFLPDHDPNEKLYRLVAAALEAIDQKKDLGLVLRYFEVWTLRLAGFFPDIGKCSICGEAVAPDQTVYLAADGSPRCWECSGGNGTEAGPAIRRLIARVLGMHPAQLEESSVPPAVSAQLGEISYQIIRHALERDLKSYPVLRRMNAG
jgi:DNA repair protein RecO (recombination protein O)